MAEIVKTADRVIADEPDRVKAFLRAAHLRGDLVVPPAPAAMLLGDGRLAVKVRLIERAPDPVWMSLPSRRTLLIGAGVCAVAGFLGLFVYALVAAASAVASNFSAVAGTLVVAAAVAWLLVCRRKGHPCVGLHCGGCGG